MTIASRCPILLTCPVVRINSTAALFSWEKTAAIVHRCFSPGEEPYRFRTILSCSVFDIGHHCSRCRAELSSVPSLA